MTQQFDVFINYNRQDRVHAERLAEILRDVGLRVWIDVSEILPGQDWFHEAACALQNCRTVLVLIGEHGVERYYRGETSSAIERATRSDFLLIPVLVPGSLPEQMPLFLRTRVYCDLRKWDKNHLTRLIDAVRPTPKVFLCHAKEDGKRVQQLANHLQERRIDAWFDKQKLEVGVNWREEIFRAIENTDFFAACLSQTAVSKTGFIQCATKAQRTSG